MSSTLKVPQDHPWSQPLSTNTKKKPSRKASKHEDRQDVIASPALSADETDLPWVTKYEPRTASDLAVHKKKIIEVQRWLEFALSPQAHHPMVLLSGPPGCGKTGTLQALAGDMDFSVIEWVNPITNTGGPTAEDAQPGDQILYQESQSKQFQNFLLRANRYPSLVFGGEKERGVVSGQSRTRKVVLIEEFPNAFFRDPNKLFQVLMSVQKRLCYPLVFILSESHHGGSSSNNLFRKEYLSKLNMHTISFNPISHTSTVKIIQKIAAFECQHTTGGKSQKQSSSVSSDSKFFLPPKGVVESLAESCNGDIRSAINSLQFVCLRDSSNLETMDSSTQSSVSGTTKRRKGSSSLNSKASSTSTSGTKLRKQKSIGNITTDLCGIGGRDTSLFLFRALGKILYFKRDTDKGVIDLLPPHLKHHERPPLLVNPESVVENTQISPAMFLLYLHENYNDFFEDLDDITNGMEYLSDSDVLGQLWSDSREVRLSYSSSVACRGLIHSNKSTAAGKWRPLHKPQWNSVIKQYHERSTSARNVFLHLGSSPYAHLWTPIELQTEILPYMAVINTKLRNPDQIALIQSITHFKTSHQRPHLQSLGEKDIETDQTSIFGAQSVEHDVSRSAQMYDCTVASLSQNSQQSSTTLSQNTGIAISDSDDIEDFDDDNLW